MPVGGPSSRGEFRPREARGSPPRGDPKGLAILKEVEGGRGAFCFQGGGGVRPDPTPGGVTDHNKKSLRTAGGIQQLFPLAEA